MRGLLRRLLLNRQVGLLWIGQVVSQTGDSVFLIGLLWLTLEMTGRESLAGLAAAALYIPTLLFGLAAGVAADRVSQRHLMMAMDVARALLVLAIPIAYRAGHLSPVVLGLVAFAVASCAAFFNPARDAFLPRLAPDHGLPHANALMQTSWQAAVLLGPAVAAALLSILPIVDLFAFDALTYGVSLLALMAIGRRVPQTYAERPQASAWSEVREGLAYVVRDPLMRMLLFVTAIDNLILMGPAIVGPPILVRDTLGIDDPRAYAWVEGALAGGMLVGAPFMATLGRKLPLGRTVLVGVILDGLTYAPLYFVRSLTGVLVVIFVHSFFIPLITVSRTTLIQRRVPSHLHGRMFAVVGMCVIGGMALSSALTGVVAEILPMPTVFLVIGIGAAATALPGFASRALREAR